MSDQRSAAAVATVRRQDTLHAATSRLAVSAWRCYSAVSALRGGCGREVALTPWWPHSKAAVLWETCGPIAPSISVGRSGGGLPALTPARAPHTPPPPRTRTRARDDLGFSFVVAPTNCSDDYLPDHHSSSDAQHLAQRAPAPFPLPAPPHTPARTIRSAVFGRLHHGVMSLLGC